MLENFYAFILDFREYYSVEEACNLARFNNLSHFSRSFKQHTGHSPK
ncbi:MAG: AraC family transcriptional regulator [Treponema sp.]|nr:AraC family transcriptional regulator [Treponema sp.]